MSGHSKWSTIKRKKGANDAKRGKIFTKIIKELTIAAKDGGSDPDANPRLRLAIQNAKGANMPKDTMERAIKKGADKDASNFQETTYEGYAPGGIAIVVEAATDNINRTVANVRSYFTKYGGNLGTNGSLDFLFNRKGVFQVKKGEWELEDFTLETIDGGAEDVELNEDMFTVTTAMEDFGNMQKKLEELKVEVESGKLERVPTSTTALDVDGAKSVLKLVEVFEDDDDVQNVYHNLEMTDELMTELSKE